MLLTNIRISYNNWCYNLKSASNFPLFTFLSFLELNITLITCSWIKKYLAIDIFLNLKKLKLYFLANHLIIIVNWINLLGHYFRFLLFNFFHYLYFFLILFYFFYNVLFELLEAILNLCWKLRFISLNWILLCKLYRYILIHFFCYENKLILYFFWNHSFQFRYFSIFLIFFIDSIPKKQSTFYILCILSSS